MTAVHRRQGPYDSRPTMSEKDPAAGRDAPRASARGNADGAPSRPGTSSSTELDDSLSRGRGRRAKDEEKAVATTDDDDDDADIDHDIIEEITPGHELDVQLSKVRASRILFLVACICVLDSLGLRHAAQVANDCHSAEKKRAANKHNHLRKCSRRTPASSHVSRDSLPRTHVLPHDEMESSPHSPHSTRP